MSWMATVPCWKKKLLYYKINKTFNVPILFGSDVCFKAQCFLLITNLELESSRYGRRDLKHSDAYHRKSVIGSRRSRDNVWCLLYIRKVHRLAEIVCTLFKMFV